MVSQAPRLWKQLLQQLDAAAATTSSVDCQPEVFQAIFHTVDSLIDQPSASKATWKRLVNDMQVGGLG